MIKRLTVIFLLLTLSCCFAIGVSADTAHIYDYADLLTAEEEATLEARIQQIMQAYPIGLGIVITNDSQGMDEQAYAETFYDQKKIGHPTDESGALLAICMDIRKYYMDTKGTLKDSFDGNYDGVMVDVPSNLTEGKYYDAAWLWLERLALHTGEYAYQDETGAVYLALPPYTTADAFNDAWGYFFLIYLPLGAIIAAISVFVMWKQCKTGVAPDDANHYADKQSLRVTLREDTFLRTAVTSRPKPKKSDDNDSDSGHGGSGGSF